MKNYAFIDGNNLYLGAKKQKISIDYRRLRLYLKNKLDISKASIFIGYDPNHVELYDKLTSMGFVLIHKPTIVYYEKGTRTMKGNVDAELVLHTAAIELQNYNNAVIVSSDGDFACLYDFLLQKRKLLRIITPTEYYSSLLKKYSKYICPLKQIEHQISKNKNAGICDRSKP